MNVWRLIIFLCLVFTMSSPAGFSAWTADAGGISPYIFPQEGLPITVVRNPENAIIAGDELCIQRDDNRVTLTGCPAGAGLSYWQSPADWQVKEAFFADLNLDQEPELVMLVWRPFRSWPVDKFLPHGGRIDSFQDANGMSCQVILVGKKGRGFGEVWAGSAMADPIHSLKAADFDGDELDELAALEYRYDGNPQDSSLVLWEWNGFGFSLAARQEGNFATLLMLENDPTLLLTIK